MHIERPTVCRVDGCALPLFEVSEAPEPISGLLISELSCLAGHGYIGARWPDGIAPHRREDDDE